MLATKLIKEIQKRTDRHGDLPITAYNSNGVETSHILVRAYDADNNSVEDAKMVKIILHVK